MVHQSIYPVETRFIYISGPLVKWPKTPASHAGNMGSNPVRVTILKKLHIVILDELLDDVTLPTVEHTLFSSSLLLLQAEIVVNTINITIIQLKWCTIRDSNPGHPD